MLLFKAALSAATNTNAVVFELIRHHTRLCLPMLMHGRHQWPTSPLHASAETNTSAAKARSAELHAASPCINLFVQNILDWHSEHVGLFL
jgi:hypothetical protein